MAQPRRLLPSMSQLAAFDAVCRTGSTLAAAADLNLTQGAVSKMVLMLEARLGLPLFHRDGRRLVPTEAAVAFERDVVRALDILSRGATRLRSTAAGGSLALAVLPGFGTRWLTPRLPAFMARSGGITVNLGTRLEPFDLDVEGFDAAIHFGAPNWPKARHMKLFDESLVACCAPAPGAEILANLPKLHLQSRPTAWTDWYRRKGLPEVPARGMVFDQFAPMIEAAVHGLGVALVPGFLVVGELADGRLIDVGGGSVPGEGSYYLVWPADRDVYPPLLAFRAWLAELAV